MAVVDMSSPTRELPEELASHRAAIHRYVLGIVRDPAEAEDLTQDTLLRAHGNLKSLQDPARLTTWLYRIATNLCRDRFRRASHRKAPLPLDADADEGGGPGSADTVADAGPRLDKALEQQEMSGCVQRYVAQLSDSYRAVILLHDVEGMTNPEIAKMLGVSLATVKIRLHRAREKLRGALAEACAFSTDERGVVVCEPKPLKIEPKKPSN